MDIGDFCEKQLINVKFASPAERNRFASCLHYFQGGYDKDEDFQRLHDTLASTEEAGNDRLYFLSVPPTVFGSVCARIDQHARAAHPGKTRVLVEKPFGRDSRTFTELNELTASAFAEAELFRLDHYLAKQSIQNFNVCKAAATRNVSAGSLSDFCLPQRQRIQRKCFFNSVWNAKYLKSVHVSWKEDIGTEGRGGYFDEFGIIRTHVVRPLQSNCARADI